MVQTLDVIFRAPSISFLLIFLLHYGNDLIFVASSQNLIFSRPISSPQHFDCQMHYYVQSSSVHDVYFSVFQTALVISNMYREV